MMGTVFVQMNVTVSSAGLSGALPTAPTTRGGAGWVPYGAVPHPSITKPSPLHSLVLSSLPFSPSTLPKRVRIMAFNRKHKRFPTRTPPPAAPLHQGPSLEVAGSCGGDTAAIASFSEKDAEGHPSEGGGWGGGAALQRLEREVSGIVSFASVAPGLSQLKENKRKRKVQCCTSAPGNRPGASPWQVHSEHVPEQKSEELNQRVRHARGRAMAAAAGALSRSPRLSSSPEERRGGAAPTPTPTGKRVALPRPGWETNRSPPPHPPSVYVFTLFSSSEAIGY
ncbi:hypothetical protein SKAU_G00385670 [Synaphobranchus kaupii]|uniref:Uncharacterized protein n=1 Tax=Synaphobranchus kaupii TaxID=118154 RepID=A0A9Q1EEK8_SYNKA|nr:hypothetical protein SKAU_G00385670 [Synaphobranchus kaupii]